MTSRIRNHVAAVCVSSLVTLTACNGNGTPDVTAPVPTRAPTTTIDPDASTTTTSTTEPPLVTTLATEPTSTDTTTLVIGEGFLPDDLGQRVDSAPGVNSPGEIVELLENVWIFVPSEPDPNDASVIPPLPEDREILAAYAAAQQAYHEQASRTPVDPVPSAALADSVLDGGQLLSEAILQPTSAKGQHLDLSAGIVLRPFVLADPRSEDEVFIFDCQFDGTVLVNDSDGSLVDGQIAGVKEFPQVVSLKKTDGRWIVDRFGKDERACI
jgi:hypothetical protein